MRSAQHEPDDMDVVTGPVSQDTPVPAQKTGWMDEVREKLTHVGNNVRLIDLYARQKDFYKIFELIGPVLGAAIPRSATVRGSKPRDELDAESDSIDQARARVVSSFRSGDMNGWRQAVTEVEEGVTNYRKKKEALEYKYKLKKLDANLVGDTLNFFLQLGISQFSSWWEKGMVVRTYEKLVREEQGIIRVRYGLKI